MEESDVYKVVLKEEEQKLRWLIARQGATLELRYYLVFLLVANQQYARALNESERILAMNPDNVIAQAWSETLRGKWFPGCNVETAHRNRSAMQGRMRGWRHSCCGDL